MTPCPGAGAPAFPYPHVRSELRPPAPDVRAVPGPERPAPAHHGTEVPRQRTEEHQP
ncbi:hypothetical protein SAMN05444921_11719 [Streptomyces wuyuanensis]|uniref:Uncharacterized protein n=1 Tax=Streptomyces wuyuanensis TaxID=1196353 RepID=A0A1G9XYE6_9ACTN|nr:hypothetical protein SAMN05444921_11719 [Streptomyces wuyuanensis]